MTAPDTMTKNEIIDLLNRCWMTHDGMWFYHCLTEFGIETANRLNKSAIRSLAPIEIARMKQALGTERIENWQAFRTFFEGAASLFIPPFMNASMDFPRENVLRWAFETDNCFAYKGIKRIGAIDRYECGVIYRLACWIDSLGLRCRVTPPVEGCLMRDGGACSGEFEITFP